MDPYDDLAALGLLRNNRIPPDLEWLSEEERQFLLRLLQAGEEGVHRRSLGKAFLGGDVLLRLSAACLVDWQRDVVGREMYLALSHRGDDAARRLLAVARDLNNRAAERRAATPVAPRDSL